MNEYIFYTTEGYTIAPNEDYDVENCQVIGRAFGKSSDEAMKNLLKENKWIENSGFNQKEFYIKQILTEEQRNDIKLLIDYLLNEKEINLEKKDERKNHILKSISRLEQI